MNADILFQAISEAPEHVAELRKIAVALAIGGHLDDPNEDWTVEEARAEILQVQNKLKKRGLLRKTKKSTQVEMNDLPEVFSDPSKFTPLGEIAFIEKGKTGIKKALPGEFPFVVTAANRETCDHYDFDGTAAIIPLVSSTGHGNASINRLHYQAGKFALGTILVAVFPHDPDEFSPRFLFEYLSVFKDELLVARMTGTANVTLTIGRISEVPVPLLSATAQRRVDELMALCDRLEEARKACEETRDKLTAATLARLTAPEAPVGSETDGTNAPSGAAPNQAEPEDAENGRLSGTATVQPSDFPTHARFAIETLPALTSRPDQIKSLRQTILNLAVRGKLVEQDATDEPAGSSLDRLKQAAAQVFREEGLRARKPVAPASRQDLKFDFPGSWELPIFDDVFVMVSGVTKGGKVPLQDAKVRPYLRVANVQRGHLDLGVIKTIEVKTTDAERYRLKDGDILMTEGGDWDKLGRAAIWRCQIEECIHQNHVFRVRPPSDDILAEWVITYVNSELGRSFFEDASKQTTNLASINMTQLRGCPLPLPPLAEQHRIVAKVDALMALCDRLEAALTTADTTRTRLLEALLHEALEPAGQALEAAE